VNDNTRTIYAPTGNGPIEYEHAIFHRCHGIVFQKRGQGDPHVCVLTITEDDGNWFISTSSRGFSSYWLPKYIELLQEAQKWLEENCDDDSHGWRFRK
jgi:hypothetical protein